MAPRRRPVAASITELDQAKFGSVNYLSPGFISFNAMTNCQLGGPRPWHDLRVREAFYSLNNVAVDRPRLRQPRHRAHWLRGGRRSRPSSCPKAVRRSSSSRTRLLQSSCSRRGELRHRQASGRSSYPTPTPRTRRQRKSGSSSCRAAGIRSASSLPLAPDPAAEDGCRRSSTSGSASSRAATRRRAPCATTTRNTNDQFSNVGLYDTAIDALIESRRYSRTATRTSSL